MRTAWLYGRHGNNFVKTMLRLAREREVLRVVDDQHGCPTWTKDLSGALAVICRRLECKRDPSLWGTYHFCGTGQTTWHGFAQAIVDAGKTREPLLVQRVEPIPTVAYPTAAQRPANSVLDCSKIEAVFGLTPRPWRESLCDFMRELMHEPYAVKKMRRQRHRIMWHNSCCSVGSKASYTVWVRR